MQAFILVLVGFMGCTAAYPSYGQSSAKGCPHVSIDHGSYSPRVPWFPYPVHRRFTKITYSCKYGYKLNGPSIAYCQTNNQWTGIPTCVPESKRVMCERPSYILHGKMSSTVSTFSIGQTVTYTCESEYEIVGEATLTCQSNGEFDRNPPRCQEKPTRLDCIVPQSILVNMNVRYNKMTYRPSELAQFTCDSGYTMVGYKYAFCGYRGKFMSDLPSCKRDGCKAVKVDANIMVSPFKTNYAAGESVMFSCEGDYQLSGQSMATCMSTGEFNTTSPKCTLPHCPSPYKPQNCRLRPRKRFYKSGQRIKFKCNQGFFLIGPKTIKCEADGKYSELEPICLPVTTPATPPVFCNVPSNVSEYEITAVAGGVLEVGDRIIVGCKPGYEPLRRFSIICDEDGQFTPSFPDCVVATCSIPDLPEYVSIANKPNNNEFKFGESITYQCAKGFEIDGHEMDVCSENGLFTSPPPQCVAIEGTDGGDNFYEESVTCQIPPITSNLILITDLNRAVTEGDAVEYMCKIGYKINGKHRLECIGTGELSEQPPTCEPQYCQSPYQPQNGEFNPQKPFYKVGETIQFKCNQGYLLIGTKTIKCEADGKYSELEPICSIYAQCKLPEMKEMVSVEPLKEVYVQGESVNFECDNIAKKQIFKMECGEDGNFHGDVDACKANVNCPLPKIPFYGYAFSRALAKPSIEEGDVIYFRCRKGYELTGPRQLTCQQDGKFFPTGETQCVSDGQIKKNSS